MFIITSDISGSTSDGAGTLTDPYKDIIQAFSNENLDN